MAARNRQRPSANIAAGKVTTYNGSGGVITTAGGYPRTYTPEVCTDHLTPGWPRFQTDHPLFIKKVTTVPPRLSGTAKLMVGASVLQRLVYEDYAFQYTWLPAEILGPDLGFYYTEALAKVNPNVPIVDIPAEVLDTVANLPSFTRGIAEYLSALRSRVQYKQYVKAVYGPKQPYNRTDLYEPINVSVPSVLSGGYVTWSFAIAPLIGTIKKLMELDQSIADRASQLKKYASEGISMQLEDSSYTLRSNVNLVGDGRQHPAKRETTYSTRVWLEASFSYSGDPIPEGLTVAERTRLKRAIATGKLGVMGVDTIWEMIPFSWLIDYFANVGSYLSALRGNATYALTGANIMRTTTLKSKVAYVGPSPFSAVSWKTENMEYTDGSHTVVIKERAQGGLPNWYLRKGWLTPHQVGILTSIGAAMAFARR